MMKKQFQSLLLLPLFFGCFLLPAKEDSTMPYVKPTAPTTTDHQEIFYALNDADKARLLKKLEIARQKKKYAAAANILHRLAQHEQQHREKSRFYLEEARHWMLAGKADKCRNIYRLLLEQFPLFLPYDQVVPELRLLAEGYANGNGTLWGIRDRKAAIGIYEMIIIEAPAIHVSIQDRIRLAELEVSMGYEAEAVGSYQEILKLDPSQKDCRLKLALLLEKISRSGDGDGARLRAAQRHARLIIHDFPASSEAKEAQAILTRAREIEALRLLELAKFYLGKAQKRPAAAKGYLVELEQVAPDTKAAQEGRQIYAKHFAPKETPKEQK